MKISEIIDSGKEKVLQLKEKQSKTKNIKIIEKTTLANGTPVHTVKNIPNDKNTQELLKAYPIDAPTVAAGIQTEMENGTLKGPNGETNINDCDSNWISIETSKRVDENIKRVSGEITSNKIDNISSEIETTQSNTKATEVPIKEEKFRLTQNKLTTKLNKVGYRNIAKYRVTVPLLRQQGRFFYDVKGLVFLRGLHLINLCLLRCPIGTVL